MQLSPAIFDWIGLTPLVPLHEITTLIQHPHISNDKLRQLYSNADIFVLPSWIEGCQLPPLEATVCKCAVVATNGGGVPDHAEDGETASIVPPRDSAALIEAVSKLIENKVNDISFKLMGTTMSQSI